MFVMKTFADREDKSQIIWIFEIQENIQVFCDADLYVLHMFNIAGVNCLRFIQY